MTSMSRARWATGATDLTATPGEASKYLTVGQLSDAIGLAPGTIKDSITRAPITNPDNPRSAICRPAARIGDLPLWTPEQRDRFLRIRRTTDEKSAVKLEAITADEARERDLYSLVELAEMFDVHDQTLRRAQSQDKDFPRAVARRRKAIPGVPEHLFKLDPMVKWARTKGYRVPETAVS
jgi:hypothetical protein